MAKNPKKLNPVTTEVKNYPEQHDGSFLEPQVTGLLPNIFRTDTNKKVLSAVLEDLMQPSSMEDLNYSVGRKTTKTLVTDYLPHSTAKRQLEAGAVVFTEEGPETLSADEIATAWGFNDRTAEPKVPVSILDLPIDPDKFINWSDYYWIEEGMPVVYINGSANETFSVQHDILGKPFFTTVEQHQQENRRLNLKNGMRIVFRQFPGMLPLNGDLDVEMLSNGNDTQAIPYELTAYNKTNIGLSVDGVLQTLGSDFTLLGSEIQWKGTPPIAGLNIYIHLPDFFITTDSDKAIRRWQVDGVGTANGIRLLGRTHQYTNTSYSKATQTLWDKTAVPWDSVEWDGILRGINAKHYITQATGAENRNANSRTNVWYHKDTISTVAEFLGIDFSDIALLSNQAIRPIVEFDKRLEVFNHGTKFRAWANLLIKDGVTQSDFINLVLSSAYTISDSLKTPVLDARYTTLLDKLRFEPSVRVTVKSGFNTQTAINKADFTDSEISKLYEEQAAAIAAGRTFKKILYSVGNKKINWLINPPANDDEVKVTYYLNQVPLSSLRILWLVNDANVNKILTLLNDGVRTTAALFETANDGDAIVIDTPIASDSNYLQEYYWKNGVAVKAQTRKSRTQLPKFELYDANLVRLSNNPKKPLIVNSTIIEPVEGTVMDPESGYKLTFLPSQFDSLTSDNPIRNAMFDIVFKHTLHDYSYYTDGDATKTIQGPYSFRRISNASNTLRNEVSSGYQRAWFQLKSWVVKTLNNVTDPTVELDASVWPTYHWSIEVDKDKLNAVSVDTYRTSVAFGRIVCARNEPAIIDVHVPDSSGTATLTGYGFADINLTVVDGKISFVVPADAPAHMVLALDQRSINIDVINVKNDPRNVKVKLNGIPATYEYNITRDGYTTTAVSLSVTGTGNLEISHQGDVYDTDDHITSLPGLELNPFQTLSLGEFSPSRLVTALTSAIETTKLSDNQSWIDTSKAPALNGALMADHSSLRSVWASLKLTPTINDVMIARSLSAWRWYRKFIDKLESNFNILDYTANTPRANLDRLLNETLVGVTYSSADALTGMAVPTDAMNHAEYLADGTKTQFAINTGGNGLYLGFYGPDIVYVYINHELVSRDDYTFDSTTNSINFNTAPEADAVVEVLHCSEVEVYSNIPASVVKLGFKGAVRPGIQTESWGDYSKKVIVRHDGSRITMFGIDEEDPRNQIILELENRIYNGCVSKYPLPTDWYPVENRAWNVNMVPATESVVRAQLEWFALNNINYRERNDYVNTNPWTWNYNGKSWKKLYVDKFNTYELDKEPWVALGYMYSKPNWWDTHYSWTDSTKRAALEYALYNGIISEPGTPLTVDSTVARKRWVDLVVNRVSTFPVDSDGKLMDPMTWGYPQPSADVASLPWEIGAWGPAEMVWRNSVGGQWNNALFAVDNKKYFSEFFDVSINPYIQPKITNSPKAKGFNSIAPSQFTQTRPSIGIGALIFEAYREFNLDGEVPLEQLLSIDSRLQFGVGGFSDGISSLKMYHTKYQTGSYVPEEDFIMTLSSGVPVSQLRYSAVRIERDDVGFRVYGFDPGQRYFEVFTPTAKSITSSFPSSRRQLVTPYGEFTEYLDWNTTPVKVMYGDYIENSQALITFLLGLGEFQKSKGIVLDAVNARGTITDWKQAALDALQWINEFWGDEHNCVVGVATQDGLKFSHERGILERLDADLGRSGKVIFGTGKSALASELLITRDYEPNVDKVVSLNNEQLVYVDFKLREYEHVIFVRRETKFKDLIIDLQTGHRLDVLSLSARRTMDWTGRPHARGVTLTETGLLPGFDTLTSDIINVHKPEQNAFDVIKSRIAKSNVVPSRATVINELIQNRTMSHLYQQGLQSSSGTTLAIDALLRNDNIDIPGRKQDIEVNEQWLFTTGNFGNLLGEQVWEVELRKQDFNTNKKIIRFSENNVENLNDNIIEYNKKDKRWITRPSLTYGFGKINRASLGLDKTQNWLPNAGVANLIDTDIQAVTIDNVTSESFKNIDPLNKTISLSASGTLTTSDIFSTNSFSRYIDYDPDDLAWNEGKLYRAKSKITGSAVSAFDTDQWNLIDLDPRLLPSLWISDFGYVSNSSYKGTWKKNTLYYVGDLIASNGNVYVCSREHTSGETFVNNELVSVSVINGGTGYENGETFKAIGDDGQFVTGTVLTRDGKIQSIVDIVDDAGGFSASTVIKVFTNGQEHTLSSRAVLLPIISPIETRDTTGSISSISVPPEFNGGNNYFANNMTVTVNGTGSGAVITPVLSDQSATTRIKSGIVTSVTLASPGFGYKVGDKLTISNTGNSIDDAVIEVVSVTTPSITNYNVNYTSGNLIIFGGTTQLTAWISGIDKSNFAISESEKASIKSNAKLFYDTILELLPNNSIARSDIDTLLSEVIDSANTIILDYIGDNNVYVIGGDFTAGELKKVNGDSFTIGNQKYTRGSMTHSNINIGVSIVPELITQSELDNVINSAVNEIAAIPQFSGSLTSTGRDKVRTALVAVVNALILVVESISDKVDLYSYSKETITSTPTGQLINFNIVNNENGNRGGQGYTVGKTYSLSPIIGSGTGGKVTVQSTTEFDTGVTIYNTGVITGFTVINPGKGYGPGTTISISRNKPRATATTSNGVITSIAVDNQGRGKNMSYTNVSVNIIPNGAGTGAIAKANIVDGQLFSITVENGGYGYSNGARVEIVDPSWKEAVTTGVVLSVKDGVESLRNVIIGISIIDGGYDYNVGDTIEISDPNRDSFLPNASAKVGTVADGSIYQTSINAPTIPVVFYSTPSIEFNSGNNSATLTPVIQSFWNQRVTGYGWNVLQVFSPMYVVETCPNALQPGLNESKVSFSNPHGLTTGDYFVLSGANDGNYDRIHKVKAKVDDYNVLIEARSTSDEVIYNMVAFKMQTVRFNSKAEYEKSKLTYDWKRGMKAYIDQDPIDSDLSQGNAFNYEFTEIEFGIDTGGIDKMINHSSYLINTPAIYKAWLMDITNQEILATIETYDPFKGVVIDDVAQYVEYKTSIDPSIYNVDEMGIKDPLVAEAWGGVRIGTLWWDTSKIRYIEYELGELEERANNWGKKFADTEVVIYEWVSSKEMPTAETPGIKLDTSSGIGQIRYAEIEELNEYKVPETVYYYWQRGVNTLPLGSTRPYTASTIEQVLDNPDANAVSWLSPIEVTGDSASILVANINDYFTTRDSVILRIEQSFRPEQKHTTGVLVTEGFNGGTVPEYLYGRLRDSLVGEDKYRTIEPITYIASGTSTSSLKVDELITFVDLDTVEFSFVTSYSGNDVPVLIDITEERPDVNFVWQDTNEPTFGVYRVRKDIPVGEVLSPTSQFLKRIDTAISKNVLKDNRFYAVTDRPRAVPDPLLHPLRRYGNNHVPRAQSWFKNATNARRTFIDCVNDFLLKIDVVSKTEWDNNLRTWQPLLGEKTLHLDPDWPGPIDDLNGFMQLWDYADYRLNDYIPGNEDIKLSSLSDLPAALVETPDLNRFAVVNLYGVTTEVYDYNNGNLTVVYRKNGTIQIKDLSDPAGWDTTRWDAKLWDPTRWDLGQILKALRENIFVGTDAGYFNLMFFAMVKESLSQIPMADWVFKTGYLTVDQTSDNDLQQVALYYDKKDGLIKDYINEVKPYHSKQIDKGTYSKSTQLVPVGIDESVVLTFIESEFLVTEVTEDKLIDRRRNGTPEVVQIPQRILAQTGDRLMVRDQVLTQVIVTEEG